MRQGGSRGTDEAVTLGVPRLRRQCACARRRILPHPTWAMPQCCILLPELGVLQLSDEPALFTARGILACGARPDLPSA